MHEADGVPALVWQQAFATIVVVQVWPHAIDADWLAYCLLYVRIVNLCFMLCSLC